jgi:hypothetical protein
MPARCVRICARVVGFRSNSWQPTTRGMYLSEERIVITTHWRPPLPGPRVLIYHPRHMMAH